MVVGQAISMVDSQVRVSGSIDYTLNFELPRMLHACMLRSPHAHAHVSDGNLEDTGELALDNVGILTARPYRDSVIGHLRHDDVGLERDVVNGRRDKSVLDDMIGLAEPLSDVTFALFEQVDDIRPLQRARSNIGAPRNNAPRSWV